MAGEPTDDSVIERAKRGDQDAWRALYRTHAARLVMWLRIRPTGDAATSADDLASEAWYVAASKVSDFDGTVDEFGGWLFGIARNLSATTRRTADRRATAPVSQDDLTARLPGIDDHALDHERLDWVRSQLATLTPRERDVIGLIDALGLTVRDAAEALGISSVAVRVARHRGLRRLGRTEGLAALQPTSTTN